MYGVEPAVEAGSVSRFAVPPPTPAMVTEYGFGIMGKCGGG
jgi:hypothetical protein